jgi:hypothetical protein
LESGDLIVVFGFTFHLSFPALGAWWISRPTPS